MTSTPAETVQDACPICLQPLNDIDPVTPDMHGDSECGYVVHAGCWVGLSTANHNVACYCGQMIDAPPCPICQGPIADRADRALSSHSCGYDMHRTCWEGLGGYAGCFCGELIGPVPPPDELPNGRNDTDVRDESDRDTDTPDSEEPVGLELETDDELEPKAAFDASSDSDYDDAEVSSSSDSDSDAAQSESFVGRYSSETETTCPVCRRPVLVGGSLNNDDCPRNVRHAGSSTFCVQFIHSGCLNALQQSHNFDFRCACGKPIDPTVGPLWVDSEYGAGDDFHD